MSGKSANALAQVGFSISTGNNEKFLSFSLQGLTEHFQVDTAFFVFSPLPLFFLFFSGLGSNLNLTCLGSIASPFPPL